MIVSTAVLVRERGARGTSLDAILAHSGAPRGSVYHHFPGGREQLLREATEYAGEYIARRLEGRPEEDLRATIEALFDEYRDNLIASDFRAGCPVLAVAIESPRDGPDLRGSAHEAFERWRRAISRRLEATGIDRERAGELATLIIAAFEGALVLSRTSRDLEPLDAVHRELRARLDAELADLKGAR
jgi:AcrR family transcriptional regulator